MMSDLPSSGSPANCPLSPADQQRNLILFAVCTGTQYLAAPVLYVGITQAALCDRLGADARTANLPGTLFFAMTAMPAVFAWLSPQTAALKRNLSLYYAASALMLAVVAGVLASGFDNSTKLAFVILQGGVSGAVMPAAIAMLWEVIGRGSDESRRGVALSLAFGAGPLLAVAGSLAQTALLGGDLLGLRFPGFPYPQNFVALFATGVPVMATAAVLSRFFVLPEVRDEAPREPFAAVTGLLCGILLMILAIGLLQSAASGEVSSGTTLMRVFGILCGGGATVAFVWHFRAIFQHRILLMATLVTILVYAGNVIPSNMNLYSAVALGDLPEKYAGIQNLLRFSFKVAAGTALGLILTRTSPRAGILTTATIFLIAQLWAMCVTGPWYLVAFGIHGAGELVGVYAPNYLVSASKKEHLRKNMAFVTMLMVPAAPAGYLYGAIVDLVQHSEWTLPGVTSAALGFRLSFLLCGLLIFSGILLALLCLPPHPASENQGPAESR